MHVIQIQQTEAYARWFRRLRDKRAKARILVRIRLAGGDKSTQQRDIRRAQELAEEL
jgi:putative component of toxin-antitoxin plasmid stabilization module